MKAKLQWIAVELLDLVPTKAPQKNLISSLSGKKIRKPERIEKYFASNWKKQKFGNVNEFSSVPSER